MFSPVRNHGRGQIEWNSAEPREILLYWRTLRQHSVRGPIEYCRLAPDIAQQRRVDGGSGGVRVDACMGDGSPNDNQSTSRQTLPKTRKARTARTQGGDSLTTGSTLRSARFWQKGRLAPLEVGLTALQHQATNRRRLVTTNGCFDLLHRGHLELLHWARTQGDTLAVAINSDQSIAKLKGGHRPLVREEDRAAILAELRCVDSVFIFDDPVPTFLLAQLRPTVHCKGSEYQADVPLPEAETVERYGGRVAFFPMRREYSSTQLTRAAAHSWLHQSPECPISEQLIGSASAILQTQHTHTSHLRRAAHLIATSLASGQKVLACGNGGSAADAAHFTAELVGRFSKKRAGLPAICLSGNEALLTAVANDFGYEVVFSRQVQALGKRGDVLVALSTSGMSENVLLAAKKARANGLAVISIVGSRSAPLVALSDECVVVEGASTPQVQVATLACLHALAALVDRHV